MSIKTEILKILITPKYRYKGVPLNAFLLPAFGSYNKESVRNNFYSLNKNGFIDRSSNGFTINKKGQNFLIQNKRKVLRKFESIENKNPKNLLLLYDIPENKKSERDWFRRTLIKFSFVMIQRSVWVGPSPLPKEFINYIKSIGLKNSIKTFRLTKGYK